MRTVQVEVSRPGKGVWRFEEHMAVDRSDLKVLLLDRHEHHAVDDEGTTILEPGSPIVWFVFPDQWYEIGSFHTPAGIFTGWYTNICTPFEMDGDQWRTTDLFLDYWQPAKGVHRFLDEGEFQTAASDGLLDGEVTAMVREVRRHITKLAAEGAWPPRVVKGIDLAQVRATA